MSISKIEKMIYVIRRQKVMLDSDLAELYEVETKYLNQVVRRHISRFPEDFMLQLTDIETESLRLQIATSKKGRGGRRYNPLVFTENGGAMLSTVLNSERAIQVNIAIMRIFTMLRSFLMLEKGLNDRMDKLEEGTNKMFKVVFEKLDMQEKDGTSQLDQTRKKIGFKCEK